MGSWATPHPITLLHRVVTKHHCHSAAFGQSAHALISRAGQSYRAMVVRTSVLQKDVHYVRRSALRWTTSRFWGIKEVRPRHQAPTSGLTHPLWEKKTIFEVTMEVFYRTLENLVFSWASYQLTSTTRQTAEQILESKAMPSPCRKHFKPNVSSSNDSYSWINLALSLYGFFANLRV